MKSWVLGLIYFAAGMVGALLFAGIRSRAKAWLLFLLSAAAAFAMNFFRDKVPAAAYNAWSIGAAAMLLVCVGMVLMLLAELWYKGKNRSAKKRSSKAARRKAMSHTLIFVTAVLVFGSAFSVLETAGNLRTASIDNTIATPVTIKSKTMNILVCGIDNDENDPYHQQKMTDVILVTNLDFENDRASLLQIPRDTYVGDLTATGKINAVYNKASSDAEGINALAQTLHTMTALPVDHYVTITMEGFRAAVDAIGGVPVTLDKEMVFHLRDANENIVETKTLPAGENVLNGEMADLFVRYRDYARADLDRLDVQRVFLAALMNKLTSLSALDLVSALNAVYPYLSTDFSLAELLSLANDARQFSAASITFLRAPGEPATKDGQSVYTLHRAELAAMLNSYMRPHSEPVDASRLDLIELQNTTSILDDNSTSLSDYSAAAG